MNVDIVFEGGGAKGLALNGAVAALEARGCTFGRLVGTSAGAITATLGALGYDGPSLMRLSLEQNAQGQSRMTEFIATPDPFSREELLHSSMGGALHALDLPPVPETIESRVDVAVMRGLLKLHFFPSVFSLVERGGLFSARGFVRWMAEQMDAGGRNASSLTFAQLYERTGRSLSLVVTDTAATAMRVLNHHTTPDCPVLWGVRMSMSIPFFWPEVVWLPAWGRYLGEDLSGHTFVDGGVVSNFALRLLISDDDWVQEVMGDPPTPEDDVVGLYLDDTLTPGGAPEGISLADHLGVEDTHGKVVGRLERVVNAMMSAGDLDEARLHEALVCRLPVKGYGTTEFHMSQERIQHILRAGFDSGDAWFRRWRAAEAPARAAS
ncbi:MAG: patatin-like phospholipase family protein [Polyangiales bacterium]